MEFVAVGAMGSIAYENQNWGISLTVTAKITVHPTDCQLLLYTCLYERNLHKEKARNSDAGPPFIKPLPIWT